MAQLITTARELAVVLKTVRPAVDVWGAALSKEREAKYAERNKRREEINAITTGCSMDTKLHEGLKIKHHHNDHVRRWWQREMILDEAVEVFEKRLLRKKLDARCEYEDQWYLTVDVDNITPVLNYLEKLCERLPDPEAQIILSKEETYQLHRAEDITDDAKANNA